MRSRFDWSGFLALAEELTERPDDESAARTAVSRAYYAAFHLTRNAFMQNRGPELGRGSDHGRMADWLALHDRERGLLLRRLRLQRNAADYDAVWSDDGLDEALRALRRARTIVSCLEDIP